MECLARLSAGDQKRRQVLAAWTRGLPDRPFRKRLPAGGLL